MNLVFLPATEPTNENYGKVPEKIQVAADISIHRVRYPGLVWYNERIREQAIAQIRSLNVFPIVLVGFSKSGLGAWNIARTIPNLVAATLIFDAPVARNELPPWGTGPFYEDDASWQKDLPLRSVQEFAAAMPASHQLVLISGTGFREEMAQLSRALTQLGHKHIYLDRPTMKHHWNSGWIEEGLNEIE